MQNVKSNCGKIYATFKSVYVEHKVTTYLIETGISLYHNISLKVVTNMHKRFEDAQISFDQNYANNTLNIFIIFKDLCNHDEDILDLLDYIDNFVRYL